MLETQAQLHANLSIMLPERPTALDPHFDPENLRNGRALSPANPQAATLAPQPTHHQQICPNCSQTLTGHHCKLVCTHCGYYLSCADYY
jgi:hypothetical protein